MSTDSEVGRDVADALRCEPTVDEEHIRAIVKDGVVTLTGFVKSYNDRYVAEQVASQVPGVEAVVQEIELRLPRSSRRTDAELMGAALRALASNTSVPHAPIEVKVKDGVIRLEGNVRLHYQKRTAENVVRHVVGVTGVENLIRVEAKRPDMS